VAQVLGGKCVAELVQEEVLAVRSLSALIAVLRNALSAIQFRPVFAGTDSMHSLLMRIFHIRDTMVLVDPATLPLRLEGAGFKEVKVEIGAGFRFVARRPSGMPS
jgi:hypothetical protein